jgi:hypothetical protein
LCYATSRPVTRAIHLDGQINFAIATYIDIWLQAVDRHCTVINVLSSGLVGVSSSCAEAGVGKVVPDASRMLPGYFPDTSATARSHLGALLPRPLILARDHATHGTNLFNCPCHITLRAAAAATANKKVFSSCPAQLWGRYRARD